MVILESMFLCETSCVSHSRVIADRTSVNELEGAFV